MKKKPVFSYFFMDLPDAKSRRLFQGAQLQIWAIEGTIIVINFATVKSGFIIPSPTKLRRDIVTLPSVLP